MTSTYDTLLVRLQSAFDALEPGADPVLRTSERSDFQANGIMSLAKRIGRPPRDVAQEIVGHVDLADVASVEVAGPGFLNLTLHPGFLERQLLALLGDERLGIAMEQTAIVLDRTGNTSAASIPLALAEAADAGRLSEGDLVLISGFGAGMTWASLVLRWGKGHDR